MRLNWTHVDGRWFAGDGPIPAEIRQVPGTALYYWWIGERLTGAGAGFLGFFQAQHDVERLMDKFYVRGS